MRLLFLISSLLFAVPAINAQGVLYASLFKQLNASEFQVRSYFSMGSGPHSFSTQTRKEILRNDTLFLQLVFETRLALPALGCSRTDTLTRTLFDPSIRHIHVSTGVITFNQQDFTLADTLWGLYDSTFVVARPPEFIPYCSNDQLKVTGPETVTGFALFDMNGKLLLRENDDTADMSFLAAGVYLLRIVAASGAEQTMCWFYKNEE